MRRAPPSECGGRQQNQPAHRTQPDQDSENNLVLALTAEVARLKKQFRQET
jgi:hypothetical protein